MRNHHDLMMAIDRKTRERWYKAQRRLEAGLPPLRKRGRRKRFATVKSSKRRKLRQRVFIRDQGACRYCGAELGLIGFTVDHVIPLALGGTWAFSNLVTACPSCNQRKACRTPQQAGMILLVEPSSRPSGHVSPAQGAAAAGSDLLVALYSSGSPAPITAAAPRRGLDGHTGAYAGLPGPTEHPVQRSWKQHPTF